ncbi:MAG: alpha/beta hydrolase [Fimbriimonadaceae bacterium]|jgi:pimeloyl-ACP methyl ester carboxylesterase|nr:alpha/beta hydrolase [Fimbriimonadaceae bacterium]
MDWKTQEITLKDGQSFSVERSSLVVDSFPIASPIRLQVARLGSPSSPPVIFLAGGPGDSSIAWLNHPPFAKLFRKAAENLQIIFLDQRGCGESEPLQRSSPLALAPGLILDQPTLLRLFREQGEAAPRELAPLLTPVQSARDIPILIHALGFAKAHLWGYSYGTHLSQAILRYAGDWIDHVVLCGFEGPDQTFKYPSLIHSQFAKIATLAQSQGVSDNLLAEIEESIDILNTNPLPLSSGSLATGFVLQIVLASWSGLANRFNMIPRLIAEIRRGEATLLEQGFLKLAERRPVFYCKDSASFATKERLAEISRQAKNPKFRLIQDSANFPFPEIGGSYGSMPLPDSFREPLASDHPIFCLTGSLDGFTPSENLGERGDGLPNLIHHEIENASHSDLVACDQANEDLVEFLGTGRTPKGGYSIAEPRFRPA